MKKYLISSLPSFIIPLCSVVTVIVSTYTSVLPMFGFDPTIAITIIATTAIIPAMIGMYFFAIFYSLHLNFVKICF